MATKNSKKIFHEGINDISSPFGYRKNPFNGNETVFHRGVDYKTYLKKLPQYGLVKGKVIRAGTDNTGAKFVEVEYPSLGHVGQYYHLDSIAVNVGDNVDENTIIGYTGNTGNSIAIHLHFGWYPIENKNKGYYDRGWSDFESYVFKDEPEEQLKWINPYPTLKIDKATTKDGYPVRIDPMSKETVYHAKAGDYLTVLEISSRPLDDGFKWAKVLTYGGTEGYIQIDLDYMHVEV